MTRRVREYFCILSPSKMVIYQRKQPYFSMESKTKRRYTHANTSTYYTNVSVTYLHSHRRLNALLLRERPFNLKGGLWFFSKKIFWFPMSLKKIFWFWWRKKKINILTLVLSEKKILNETKNHNPPLQVKWSVPKKSWKISKG